MRNSEYIFSQKKVTCLFDASFEHILTFCSKEKTVIITDEHVYDHHKERLDGFKIIRITPGEKTKKQRAVDNIIDQLLALEVDKQTFIVGVGGGVVTDIAGYVASIFKRGV